MIVKALFFSFLFQKIKRDSSTPFSRLVWVSIWSFIIHKEIVSGFICNPIFLRLEFVCEDKVRSQINPHRGCYNHEVKHNASLWNDHSSNIFCSVSTWWKHPAFIRSGTICCTNYSWSALIKKSVALYGEKMLILRHPHDTDAKGDLLYDSKTFYDTILRLRSTRPVVRKSGTGTTFPKDSLES